jgi:ribonuclease Z
MTARGAAWTASEARSRHLVLTHFSQRYDDERLFAAEAAEVFGDVVAARDVSIVAVPTRR